MKARTNKILSFTKRSSFALVADTVNCSARPLLPTSVILARARSEFDLIRQGDRLIEQARLAFMLRENQVMEAASSAILELPLPSSLRAMGEYYSLQPNSRAPGEQRERLAKIISEAAPGFRERVMLQYARTYLNAGDAETAAYHYSEAARASRGVDTLSHLQSLRLMAVCRSISGDGSGALKDLQRLGQPMSAIQRCYPVEYFEYLNSLAVELAQAGKSREASELVFRLLATSIASRFPNWLETKSEIAEIEAKGATAPPLIFAIGSVYEPAASQLEGESRAKVSIGTKPEPAPETVRAQAVPLAQPKPARTRAIATSYKREAIPLAAIPLVKLLVRRAPQLPAGTSEKCSVGRSRLRALHDLLRHIRSKPARAPPTGVLPIYHSPLP